MLTQYNNLSDVLQKVKNTIVSTYVFSSVYLFSLFSQQPHNPPF